MSLRAMGSLGEGANAATGQTALTCVPPPSREELLPDSDSAKRILRILTVSLRGCGGGGCCDVRGTGRRRDRAAVWASLVRGIVYAMPRLFRRRPKHAESGVFCVLLFPDSAESRWVERLPSPGTRIRSRQGGAVWVVDTILQSGRETYTVSCVDPRAVRAVGARTVRATWPRSFWRPPAARARP